jgi:hypothetical protein
MEILCAQPAQNAYLESSYLQDVQVARIQSVRIVRCAVTICMRKEAAAVVKTRFAANARLAIPINSVRKDAMEETTRFARTARHAKKDTTVLRVAERIKTLFVASALTASKAVTDQPVARKIKTLSAQLAQRAKPDSSGLTAAEGPTTLCVVPVQCVQRGSRAPVDATALRIPYAANTRSASPDSSSSLTTRRLRITTLRMRSASTAKCALPAIRRRAAAWTG